METRRVSLLVGKQSYNLLTSMTEARLNKVSRLLTDTMANTDPQLQQDERLFLVSMILASSLYSLLYQIWNRGRLRHLAGILYGGERLRLVFAKGFYYLLDPSRLTITDVSQQAGFTIDEVVAVAVDRSAAHQLYQRLHNLLVRNAVVSLLILHGIGSPSRLLLLALDGFEIYGWSRRCILKCLALRRCIC